MGALAFQSIAWPIIANLYSLINCATPGTWNESMCLILIAYRASAQFELVVAANRDEFYARPTRIAEFWPDHPELLAGKDMEMDGTWLGITRHGRFAAVTNYRETPPDPLPPRSRGELTTGFLLGSMPAEQYLEELMPVADQYRGFNLLVGDTQSLHYFCNRDHAAQKLAPGIYGLSNHELDCTWPKVVEARATMTQIVADGCDEGALLALLAEPGDRDTPLSARFIASPNYGTRCSTLLKVAGSGEVTFRERNFAAEGVPAEERFFQFALSRDAG